MKRVVMMMAMAVGLTSFAAQNDKLITFSTPGPDRYADGSTVVDGECYALVWVKDGATFGGFNFDGTVCDTANNALAMIAACAEDGRCPGFLFQVPAADVEGKYAGGSFSVYLLDTRDSYGRPSAVTDGKVARICASGLCPDAVQKTASAVMNTSARLMSVAGAMAALTANGIEPEAVFERTGPDAYADGAQLAAGERYLLVGRKEGAEGGFRGVTRDCALVDSENDVIVKILSTANENGGCDTVEVGALTAGYVYQVIVLDTRLPGGGLSGEITFDGVVVPRFNSGWGELLEAGPVQWHANKLGASAFLKQFNFDPSQFLAEGYAAIHDENGEQVRKLGFLGGLYGLEVKDSWMVFPYPKATVTQIENKVLKPNDNYSHLREGASLPDEFTLESTYQYDSFSNETERAIVQAVLTDRDITKSSFNLTEALLTIEGGNSDPKSLQDLSGDQMAFLGWYMRNVPFFGWNCDFVVSFSEGVEKDSFVLAGFYDYMSAWSQYAEKFPIGSMTLPWIGSSSEKDLSLGEPFRLLQSYQDGRITVNYSEICTKVKTFQCGVYNGSSNNWGKTISVRLNLYPNYGQNNEDGRSITVDTQRYTFKGPLNVKFFLDEGFAEEITGLSDAWKGLENDGSVEIRLPNYAEAVGGLEDNETFVGWMTEGGATVMSLPVCTRETAEKKPVKSWYGKDEPLKLCACIKAAQKATIEIPKPEGGTASSDIKVDEEWAEANLPNKTADIKTDLESKVNDKSNLTYWQSYLLGIDLSDPNASLKVDKTNGKEEDHALVVSTITVAAPDAGLKVAYSLDKVDADEKEVKKEGDVQATKDLRIELEPADDTPTGYYKMNVIVTPVKNGEEGDTVKIPADNTIGVLKVETEDKIIPVAVPWTSLNDQSDIKVSEVVRTSTLESGDMMHVYDQVKGRYDNWKLDANGEWSPVASYRLDAKGKVDYESPEDLPTEKTVPQGAGVWLERKDTSKPFYLIGQYDKNSQGKSQVKPPAETAERPEYNLIAPTGIEDTDLNEVQDLVDGTAQPEDKLMVLKKGVPKYYTFKDGKWGYNKQVYKVENGWVTTRTERCVDDAKVQAGTGLWYISAGGSAREIDWSKKVEATEE